MTHGFFLEKCLTIESYYVSHACSAQANLLSIPITISDHLLKNASNSRIICYYD